MNGRVRFLLVASLAATQSGCVAGVMLSAGPVFSYTPGQGAGLGWSAGGGPFLYMGSLNVAVSQSYRPGERLTRLDFQLQGLVPVGVANPAFGIGGGPAWSSLFPKAGGDFSAWGGFTFIPPPNGGCATGAVDWGVSLTFGLHSSFGTPEFYFSPQFGAGAAAPTGCFGPVSL